MSHPEHHRRDQGPGRADPAQPAECAQCAQFRDDGGDRGGGRCVRGGCRDRLPRRHRVGEGVRRRRRHQGDGEQELHGRIHGELHRHLGPARPCPQAGDRGGRGLCARRRLRTRHAVRHHHRRRHREIRPAGDQARHHSGDRRHPAPDPRRRQGEGDGPDPHRADDGCGRGRALRPRRPRRAGGRPPGRGDEDGRHHRRDVAALGDGGEGGGEPRLRDLARRRRRVRAAGLPRAVRDRGPEGRHGGFRREAAGEVREPGSIAPQAVARTLVGWYFLLCMGLFLAKTGPLFSPASECPLAGVAAVR